MSTPQRWLAGVGAAAISYVTLVGCLSATDGPEVPPYLHSLAMGGLVVASLGGIIFWALDRFGDRLVSKIVDLLIDRLVEPVATRVATLILNVIVDRVATRIVVLLGLPHVEVGRVTVEAPPATNDALPSPGTVAAVKRLAQKITATEDSD